jgi:hypothetical protein
VEEDGNKMADGEGDVVEEEEGEEVDVEEDGNKIADGEGDVVEEEGEEVDVEEEGDKSDAVVGEETTSLLVLLFFLEGLNLLSFHVPNL